MSILLRKAAMADCRHERRGDLRIENGTITAIGTDLPAREGEKVIDCTGLWVLPSFVDLHAHFRDPGFTHKEDIESGCLAAAHGGYTYVNLMPNTSPICSSMETVKYVRAKAEAQGICDVHQTLAITKDFDGKTTDHLLDRDEDVLWISDDGVGVEDTTVILNVMRQVKEWDIGLMLHEEYRALTPLNTYLSEELPTFRDVELAIFTGCRTHFCHVSTARAMDYVIEGKRRCDNITCEVSPHHLALNDFNGGKVAPPLRSETDRKYLIDCIKAGYVDAIATDHAPHSPQEKKDGANGFTGLDLSFATCYTTLVREENMTLGQLSRLMSYNPAQMMNLPPALIEEGLPANLVMVDLDTPFVAGEQHIVSRSKNSPILGQTLYGTVTATIKGGKLVYEKQ